ncbi:uncharacterized protein LOC108089293 [Drosophila ficusphila]|uniref:uncharacterized protein LOC108089293 n=1 Tax=Drosophila ficusphila TaxID=30025 RepID=UPI0007E670EE|nr:uncharacterized protein LOC108089293 [Drosophila ficusphila]
MRSSQRIAALLCILFTLNVIPIDSVVFKLTNVLCGSYNETWVRINHCRLKAINRQRTVFNFNATFLYPTRDIWVHYQLFKRESGYKPWLINAKIDGCRFLRKPYDSIGILMFNIYKDFSNFNHTCPYYGDVVLKNMYLSTDKMRLPMPTGDYLLAINWIFYHKPQFSTNVSFQFVEDLM